MVPGNAKVWGTPPISKGQIRIHTRRGYLGLLEADDICATSASVSTQSICTPASSLHPSHEVTHDRPKQSSQWYAQCLGQGQIIQVRDRAHGRYVPGKCCKRYMLRCGSGEQCSPELRKLSRLTSFPLKRRLRQARRPLMFQVTMRMLAWPLPRVSA